MAQSVCILWYGISIRVQDFISKNKIILETNVGVTTTPRNFQDLLFTHRDEVNL